MPSEYFPIYENGKNALFLNITFHFLAKTKTAEKSSPFTHDTDTAVPEIFNRPNAKPTARAAITIRYSYFSFFSRSN